MVSRLIHLQVALKAWRKGMTKYTFKNLTPEQYVRVRERQKVKERKAVQTQLLWQQAVQKHNEASLWRRLWATLYAALHRLGPSRR